MFPRVQAPLLQAPRTHITTASPCSPASGPRTPASTPPSAASAASACTSCPPRGPRTQQRRPPRNPSPCFTVRNWNHDKIHPVDDTNIDLPCAQDPRARAAPRRCSCPRPRRRPWLAWPSSSCSSRTPPPPPPTSTASTPRPPRRRCGSCLQTLTDI